MVNYEKCPTYMIYGAGMWDSYIYKTKEKAIAKLIECLDTDSKIEITIEYLPDGQVAEGFNEDLQRIEND